jgi:hypothetical protein
MPIPAEEKFWLISSIDEDIEKVIDEAMDMEGSGCK